MFHLFNGIVLSNASQSLIINNTIANNDLGVDIMDSENVTVANNTIFFNYEGISISRSDYTEIRYNLLQRNDMYGVRVTSAFQPNIKIHHNTFIDNNLEKIKGSSHAYDIQGNTFWYDPETMEGNYWSDWNGTGKYKIGGSILAYDPYPLKNPTVPPLDLPPPTTTASSATSRTSSTAISSWPWFLPDPSLFFGLLILSGIIGTSVILVKLLKKK